VAKVGKRVGAEESQEITVTVSLQGLVMEVPLKEKSIFSTSFKSVRADGPSRAIFDLRSSD
jgi:hypothetical protein